MSDLPKKIDRNLLVGQDTSDDAAVYKLSEELALIVTLDFFTPMVDDPYLFGQIAAANSLSDVYAMGGKPLLALNIACLPNCLSPETISLIMRGGAEKVLEAGAIIAGGHSVQDEEPKYGLAVVGLAHPGEILSNATVRPGDALLLTKPLGAGIISSAAKGNLVKEETWRTALRHMAELNKEAAAIAGKTGAGACTDITGFGLLGHAAEMANASMVTLHIEASAIPLMPEVKPMASMGIVPAGAYQNRSYLENTVVFHDNVTRDIQDILFDPQTSGGLLIAVPAAQAEEMLHQMHKQGLTWAAIIGKATSPEDKPIVVQWTGRMTGS